MVFTECNAESLKGSEQGMISFMCFTENLAVILGAEFGGGKVKWREYLGGYCSNAGKSFDGSGEGGSSGGGRKWLGSEYVSEWQRTEFTGRLDVELKRGDHDDCRDFAWTTRRMD